MIRVNRAMLAGLAVVVLWASAFPAIRVAVPGMGAIGLSFVRLVTAAVVLLAVAVVVKVRLPRRCDLGWILGCGFFGMAAYQLLLNESEVHVPAGTASIIVAAAPLVSVAVARVLFSEPVTASVAAGSGLALAGVAIVCLARSGLSLSGAVWLAVGAMVVQGIYHPLQRPLLRTYSGLEVATYAMVAGTVMTVPIVPLGWSDMSGASTSARLGAVYLGVLPSALGFVLWGYATSHMPVAVSTSLLYLVPPITVVIAWFWIGEIPTTLELLGGVIVVAGVVTVSRGHTIRTWLSRRGRPPLPDPATRAPARCAGR